MGRSGPAPTRSIAEGGSGRQAAVVSRTEPSDVPATLPYEADEVAGGPFATIARSTLPGVNGHAPQQPAAVGLDDLGRFAKHPRTSFAQPHDKIGARRRRRQVEPCRDAPAKRHRRPPGHNGRQDREADGPCLERSGRGRGPGRRSRPAAGSRAACAVVCTAAAQSAAPARTSGNRHVGATASQRAMSGLRKLASTTSTLPSMPWANRGASRASVIVLPWPSAGLVNNSTCDTTPGQLPENLLGRRGIRIGVRPAR